MTQTPESTTALSEYGAMRRAVRHGWTTIDRGGWCGNLICHRDDLEEREGAEYGSWRDCVRVEGLEEKPRR